MATQIRKVAGRRKATRAAQVPDGAVAGAAQADPEIVRMAASIARQRAAERKSMIATAAYYRAQQRGFEPGHELEDWLAAEAEIANPQLSAMVAITELNSRSVS